MIVTPVKKVAPAAAPDPQGKTPPPGMPCSVDLDVTAVLAAAAAATAVDKENTSTVWSVNELMPLVFDQPKLLPPPTTVVTSKVGESDPWKPQSFGAPTTTNTTAAAAAGLSVSFPDFAEFIQGMEKNTSANLSNVLNTSGYSLFCAGADEQKKTIVPVRLASTSAADLEPHLVSDNDAEPVVDVDDVVVVQDEQPDALDKLVAAADQASVSTQASTTLDQSSQSLSSSSSSPDAAKAAVIAIVSPAAKTLESVPALTPESTGQSSSTVNDSNSSNESDDTHNDKTVQMKNGQNKAAAVVSDEDALVNEAYNSVNVSVMSITDIFGAPAVLLEPDTPGKLYSSQVSEEYSYCSSATDSSVEPQDRSMFGDWAAEVMSIEVSLEAGKFTLRKWNKDDAADSSCIAREGHFLTRAEYMPRLVLDVSNHHQEHQDDDNDSAPADEIALDAAGETYYVKAEWNEFMPSNVFASSCNAGESFDNVTDMCGAKKWIMNRS